MKKTFTVLTVLSWLALGTAHGAGADIAWYDSAWGYRRKITVAAGDVATNLTSFPVLLSVTNDSSLSGHANTNGTDFVITASNGTSKLYRELEEYISSNGTLVLWFNAPSLSTNTDNEFYVYYGNPTAAETNDTATWDAYFKLVQHFEEDPTSGGGYEAIDSSSNDNDANSYGPMTNNDLVAGKIGDGWEFDGTEDSDYASVANNATLNMGTDDFTLSTWIYWKSAPSNYGHLLTTWNLGDNNGPRWSFYVCASTTLRWTFYVGNAQSGVSGELSGGLVGKNNWYYLTMAWERGVAARVYVNGDIKMTGKTGSWLTGDSLTSNKPFYIGKRGYSPYREYGGILDEVRVAKGIARSAGWIKTSYDNQLTPGSFCTLAEEEAWPGGTIIKVR